MDLPSISEPKDNAAELAYQARHAAARTVTATPRETFEKYRDCRNWRWHRKQYTFHLMHKSRPANVLDFGCGAGEACTQLAFCGYQVTGIDLSPELIEQAVQRAELDGVSSRCVFVTGDGGEAPFPDNSFDVILVAAVLHHVDLSVCLRQLNRILKPGGYIVTVEPVGYSKRLQKLRDIIPVEKDISPNERQLGKADLKVIAEHFEILEMQHFHLTTRLNRIISDTTAIGTFFLKCLGRLDWLLLKIPGMSHFAGSVVLRCRKRPETPA